MVIIYEEGKLRANAEFLPPSSERITPRRLRRGFYVGECCAIAIGGQLPLAKKIPEILPTLAMAVMSFEQTDEFSLPEGVMNDDIWFCDKHETVYVIMTLKGLYYFGKTEGFVTLDHCQLHSFGPMSPTFMVAMRALDNVDDAMAAVAEFTRGVGRDYLIFERDKLKPEFHYDPDANYDRWIWPVEV